MYKKVCCCQKCGTTKNLEVHHKTYKNLGHEKLSDLLLLCHEHHFREHRKKRGLFHLKPSDFLAIIGVWFYNNYGISEYKKGRRRVIW